MKQPSSSSYSRARSYTQRRELLDSMSPPSASSSSSSSKESSPDFYGTPIVASPMSSRNLSRTISKASLKLKSKTTKSSYKSKVKKSASSPSVDSSAINSPEPSADVPIAETPVDSAQSSCSEEESYGLKLKRKLSEPESESAELLHSLHHTLPHPTDNKQSTNTNNNTNRKTPNHLKVDNQLTRGISSLKARRQVYVAIDLEYWEINNEFLTEIGIAVYDPTRLTSGSNQPVLPKIAACHYVVAEHKDKLNGRYVANNKFKFSFGETLMMSMDNCKQAVNEILAQYAGGGTAKSPRMVIVGHGVRGDMKMLRKHNFTIPEHYDVLDTMDIWRLTRKTGAASLSSLLKYFEIPHGLMHNAGNDAYLNMLLFLTICDPEVRRMKQMDDLRAQELIHIAPAAKKRDMRGKDLSHRTSNSAEAVAIMLGTPAEDV